MKKSIEQFMMQHHTAQSYRSYMAIINVFLFNHPRAKYYKYKDLIEYVNDLHQQYANKKTLKTVFHAVKRYYDYLAATGQRTDNPCHAIKINNNYSKDIQLQNLFTSQELELLLTREARNPSVKVRNQVIISLLIYQGLTSHELTHLDVKDIDLDTGTVYVKASNKLSSRTLELKSTQIISMDRYIHEHRKKLLKCNTPRLLVTLRGEPDTVRGIMHMLLPLKILFPERSLNATTIRMSFISNLLNERKLPLEQVQLIVGHHNPSSTERYRKPDSELQKALINQFHPLQLS